ncbi:DNA polymerase epsilon subunit 4 isoform X2 [Phyllobates terribilis]|uniref:DNA polymerase epsilon subunit 4 isoform X2 n=1 Tax=Phyllobates terribilis TaxID=111132 RepID=UPI003CCAE37F
MAAEEEVMACGAAQPGAGESKQPENAPPPPAQPAASLKLAKLPMSRIKSLMKSDPDVSLASQEAVFAISKAAELFIETIAKDAYVYAQRGKRKTLQRKDLAAYPCSRNSRG